MGSNTVEVTIVLNSQGKDRTMTECNVKSTVTETENDCSTNANQPVLEPDARQPKFIVWKMLEYAILSALIAMVWGLLLSSTVLYYVVSSLQTFSCSCACSLCHVGNLLLSLRYSSSHK